MKKKEIKTIDLEIIDEIEDSGVKAIALVENPAIMTDFLYFKDESSSRAELEEILIEMASQLGHTEESFANTTQKQVKQTIRQTLPGINPVRRIDNEQPVIMYRYAGPPAERKFCKAMLSLKRYYSFEELEAMSTLALNPGFGREGASTYNIFSFKGGPNCKHYWQKFEFVRNEKGKIVVKNLGPAGGNAGTIPYEMPKHGYFASFEKFSLQDDQMLLVGPAMIPDMEIIREYTDDNGKGTGEFYNVRFSCDTIAKVAEKFMREQSVHNTNEDHDETQDAGTYVFESWIVEDPKSDKAKTVYGFDVPKGTWMVKMRVKDSKTWERVKAGELKGFSVEGSFIDSQEYERYLKDKQQMEKIMKIIRK